MGNKWALSRWLLFLLPISLAFRKPELIIFSLPINLALFLILLIFISNQPQNLAKQWQAAIEEIPPEARLSLCLLGLGSVIGLVFAPNLHRAFIDWFAYLILPAIILFPLIRNRFQQTPLSLGLLFFCLILVFRSIIQPPASPTDSWLLVAPSGIYAIFFLWERRRPRKIKVAQSRKTNIALYIIAAFIALVCLTRLSVMAQQGNQESRIQQQILSTAYYDAKLFPVSGTGLDGFSFHYQKSVNYAVKYPVGIEAPSQPNNLFLSFWLNMGLPGLLGLIGLLILILSKPLPYSSKLAILSLIILGLTQNVFFRFDLAWLFWIHLSLAFMSLRENYAR